MLSLHNKEQNHCYGKTPKDSFETLPIDEQKKVDNIHTGVRTRVSRVKGGDPKPLDYEDSL